MTLSCLKRALSCSEVTLLWMLMPDGFIDIHVDLSRWGGNENSANNSHLQEPAGSCSPTLPISLYPE